MHYFTKKKTVCILAVTAVIGSVIAFYATNLILSDVSNMFYMTVTKDFITSLPIFFAAVQLVAVFGGVLDLYAEPDRGRKTALGCTAVLELTTLIGIISTFVSYLGIYKNFMAPYPFRGACIVLLVYYVICFAAASYLRAQGRSLPETEKEKRKIGEVVFRIIRFVFIFYAFNRLGAVILSPLYIQWRSFGLTCPFYISMLLPVALLILMIYAIMDFGGRSARSGLVFAVIIFAADIILNAYIFTVGRASTRFTAAISPAVPIERLLSKPIVVIIACAVATVLSIYALIYMSRRCKNDKRGN